MAEKDYFSNINPTKLFDNIYNSNASLAKKWFMELPSCVERLRENWSLSDLKPINNMTWSYIAEARKNNEAVILKIAFSKDTFLNELKCLEHFQFNPNFVKLLKYNSQEKAFLLGKAQKGVTLKSHTDLTQDEKIAIYGQIINKLHSTYSLKENFPSLKDWLEKIEYIPYLPKKLNDLIKNTKIELLLEAEEQTILHGDLHFDNLILDKDNWLVIDPMGVVGEKEFEAVACDFFTEEEKTSSNLLEIFEPRLKILANHTNLNEEKLRKYYLVKLALMASWAIEDNLNPRIYSDVIKKIFN